jgi:anti-sigma regulatory factor (Ser/Thr protein kinase)
MICPYDQRTAPPDVLTHARRTHPQFSGGEACHEYADPTGFCTNWPAELTPAPEDPHLVLHFDSDPAPVRRFVVARSASLGLPPARVDDLVLAVNEVATNAIRHGAGHGRVRLWRDGRYLLCEVFDQGRVTRGLFGCLPPDLDTEGGHGLWITRQLCDLVDIHTGTDGTTVRLFLRCA